MGMIVKADLHPLQDLVLELVDEVIETESAFGMVFAGVSFEARYKGDNWCAYPKPPHHDVRQWSQQLCLELLAAVRDYLQSVRVHAYARRVHPEIPSDVVDSIIDRYKVEPKTSDLDIFVQAALRETAHRERLGG